MGINDLRQLLEEVTNQPCNHIQPSTELHKDLGLCSYDLMTLIALIEAHTHKQVNIIDFSKQMTIESLLQQINQ